MKMALKIFRRDLRRLGRNPAALLIAAGLCLIPALYAWLNLAAGRDPYSNTQGILVAVADCDEGAANERRSLDAGRKILDNLKENEELGWVFTDEAEALEGVKAGRYYAAIVIPEDFSRELLAIEAGEIGAPEIRYYVNEKRNAVAPKITDKGADAVQEKINQSFSEEASRAVAEELQDFGAGMAGTLETKSDEILGLLVDTRANLAEWGLPGGYRGGKRPDDPRKGDAGRGVCGGGRREQRSEGGLRPDRRSQKESGRLQHGLCREHKRRGGLAYGYIYRKYSEAEQPGDGSRADV